MFAPELDVEGDTATLLYNETINVPSQASTWREKFLGYLYSFLSAILPEFLPGVTSWDRNCLPFFGWLPALFTLEVFLVTLMHLWPCYKTFNDTFGSSGTLAKELWIRSFRFIGIISSGFCVVTWAFGYISPEWWSHQSIFNHSLYGAHFFTALARCIASLLFSGLLVFRPWLIATWQPYRWLFVWSMGMFVISLVHLAIAGIRNFCWGTDNRPILHRSQLAMRGPEYDAPTGLKMKLDSPLQRKVRQTEARALLAKKEHVDSPEAVWYHPKSDIDREDQSFHKRFSPLWWFTLRRLFSPFGGSIIPKLVEDQRHPKLFSRCYCCLDLLPKARSLEHPSWWNFLQLEWASLRRILLSLPRHSHSFIGFGSQCTTSPSTEASATGESLPLNHLCLKCETMARDSILLDLMGGYTPRRVLRFFTHALNPFSLADELFEHWPTFPQLRNTAQNGCHLCNLILDTLSSDQQNELCKRDESLEREMAELHDGAEARKRAIKVDRAVYIRIRAPATSNIELGKNSDRRYANSSLLLYPHFGYARVPRRWIKKQKIVRAHSLNMDPGMKWNLEHIEPIEIRRSELSSKGSICLETSHSTASIATLNEFINPWLDKHQHSEEAQASQALPGRLLDLRPSACGDRDIGPTVQVVRQSQYGDAIRYAALSYCWRENETNKLTGESGDQAQITVSQLAPSIRDAISVTKGLGLRYLWVDALCMQQDPTEVAELQKMCEIYSNASFVISAVAAIDSSESFVVDRSPLAVNPCLLGVQSYTSVWGTNTAHLGGIYALPARKYASAAMEDVALSRLASRGWVFQEERLASRTLSFTDHQVILQCNVCDSRASQLNWEKVVPWSQKRYYNLVRPDLVLACYKLLAVLLWHNIIRPGSRLGLWKLRMTHEPPWETEEALDPGLAASFRWHHSHHIRTKMWFDLVEAYTLRFLTSEKDRLPAIRGLATRMERLLGDRIGGTRKPMYFEGVFDCQGFYGCSDSLVPSLLWYVSDARTVRPELPAPSWSWGSVNGSIKNNSTLAGTAPGQCEIELLKGPGTTGNTVQLRGKLRLATWRKAHSDEPKTYYFGHHSRLTLDDPNYHRQFIPVGTDPTSGPEVNILHNLLGEDIGYFLPDTDEELPANAEDTDAGFFPSHSTSSVRNIFCLQIIVRPQDADAERDFSVPWATRGLALIRIKPHSNIYRRVGYIELSRDHPGMEFFRSSPNKGRNRRKRHWPVLDRTGFFGSGHTSMIKII